MTERGSTVWAAAQEVTIPSGDASIAGWFLTPGGPGTHPCVVMGHGFSLTRYDGMAAYAEAFLAAGCAVLAFDYRYFGDSAGQPRQRFRTSAQLTDWRNATAFARADERVDGSKLVLWGYSFGGGHATRLAAEGQPVAAVLALCPFVDGLRRVLATPPAVSAWLIPKAIADMSGRHNLVPVTAQPGEKGAMTLAGEADGFFRSAPDGSPWRNEISPGIFLTVAAFRPVTKARRLSMPLFVGRGDRDITTNAKSVGRLAVRSSKGELHDYPADHFDVLLEPTSGQIAADMVTFLRANHLTD
jgi:uncharacterized protein